MTFARSRSLSKSLFWQFAATSLVLSLVAFSVYAVLAAQPGNPTFQRTWQRTDKPVLDGAATRTWMWGPEAFTEVTQEPYAEAPGGSREVQYYDKARMEITQPDGDAASIWYVTNGLLVVELITGNMQTGDATFEQRGPAAVNVAGDADDPTGPTYDSFANVLDAPPLPIGSPSAPFAIAQSIDRSGAVTEALHWANYGIGTGYLDEVTNHAIAQPFWDFMNSNGTVYEDGQFINEALFENPYFATGRPVTEAYWASVKVAGTYRDVLMQCFERRCLTYTPDNPQGFIVEAGNVGQHYFAWRYDGTTPPTPAPTTMPGTIPTATAEPTGSAEPTTSSEPTATTTATAEPTPTTTPEPATEYAFLTQWGQPDNDIKLNEPNMMATAPNGDIYVTNTAENRILRFASNGEFITAWGSTGSDNGRFNTPIGIGVDGMSNVYVADFANHRIQKFDANGAFITTWGSEGTDLGEFKYPYGLAVGPDGTVYVTDQGNNRVQRFYDNGIFVKAWGGLGTGPNQFTTPHGIAVNGSLVYVADTGNQRVQVFNVDGAFQGSLGVGGDEPGQFSLPLGLTVGNDDTVYVSDIGHDNVQLFTLLPEAAQAASRNLAAVQYQYAGMVGESGQFNNPLGLGFDRIGRLVVADTSNNALQFFVRDDIAPPQPGPFTLVDTWLDATRGRFGTLMNGAQGKDGGIYVVDLSPTFYTSGDAQIQVFSPDGDYLDQWRGLVPSGLVFDSQGNLFTYNFENSRIEKFSPDGEFLEGWGPATPPGTIPWSLMSLAVDADDNVYILDRRLNTLQKFSAEGVFLDAWGAPGNQPGQFSAPLGIAIRGELVYVADGGNNRVQVFDLNGTFIKQWGSEGSGDDQFDGLNGIALDNDGYVYVTDIGEDRVQKFSPEGKFLAKWGSSGSGSGQFYSPASIFVDPAGDVYVLDIGSDRIQVFRPVN